MSTSFAVCFLGFAALASSSFPAAALLVAAGTLMVGWPWSPLFMEDEASCLQATRRAVALSKRVMAEPPALTSGGSS